MKSKKAQGMNYTAITATLLIFGMMNLIFYAIFAEFVTQMDSTGFLVGEAKSTADNFLVAFQSFDWLAVLLLVGLLIALGVTSFRIASSALFFIF